MVFPKISDPKPSTSTTYGGLEMSKLQDYFSGVDIAAGDDTNKPDINTETRFESGKLLMLGSGVNSTNIARFTYPENVSITVPEAEISLPNNLSDSQRNEFVFADIPQILTGKEIDASVNAITNISNENVSVTAGISWSKINKAGSQLGDISNIDLTGRVNHSSIYWDAVAAKWVIFQPSNGLDVYLANLNDVVLSSPTAGQMLEYNGTMWHNINSPQVSSISKGVYTGSGNGTNKVFAFAHGVTDATPNVAFVEPRSDDAVGVFKVTIDATNITVTYSTAPPSGTNNVVLQWMCSDPFGTANNGIDVSKIVKYNQTNTYGAFDQIIPSGNLNLLSSGFKASLAVNTLAADIVHTFPVTSQNIVGDTATQTISNKRIDSLSNSGGTVTMPAGPTTVMGHNTTNQMYNKTINISDNNTVTGLTDSSVSVSAAIAWSKISKIGSSIADFGDMAIASPANNQFLMYNGTKWINTSVSAGGETNDAVNIGVGGVGVYKQKTGVNLELKKINAGSNVVTVTDDTTNNEVDIDLNLANILLQNLGGIATWSQVSKTGASLSDFGGTVSNSQIAANAVTLGKMATDSVDASKIVDGSIMNAEINASAAIAYSKLNLATSIVNADVSTSAAIAYSKLNLATSIVNADVSTSAAIAYSKLSLGTSIVNADISTSAAIAWSKISKSGSVLADIANVVLTSPATNQVLTYNGTNWVNQTPSSSGGIPNPYTTAKFGDILVGGIAAAAGTDVGSNLCKGWKLQVLTGGSVTNDIDADGQYYSLNSGSTTSQTNAEINSTIATIFRSDLNPKAWFKIKYPTSIVNTRCYIVFTDLIALVQNSSNALNSQNGFGFYYDTSNLSTVQLITNNANATDNLVDTAFTPTLNTAFTVKIEIISSSSTAQITINNGTPVTTTTKVPASTAKMGFLCRMQNTTGSTRDMRVYYIHVEQDK
jgi:hypothetical protein